MQLEFFEVPSPCVSVCRSDEKGLCLGCLRSRDERLNWNNYDSNEKQKVIKRCILRKKRQDNSTSIAESPLSSNIPEPSLYQPSLLDPPAKIKPIEKDDLDFTDFEL